MGAAYAAFFGGIAFIVIAAFEGIVTGVFLGLGLMLFSAAGIAYGRKRDL